MEQQKILSRKNKGSPLHYHLKRGEERIWNIIFGTDNASHDKPRLETKDLEQIMLVKARQIRDEKTLDTEKTYLYKLEKICEQETTSTISSSIFTLE